MHEKIISPDELLALSVEQLFQRLKPILYRGGLCASKQRLARTKQNLSSVCWELGEKWKANPHLAGLNIAFADYLAITLANTLRAAERKQNRHLYDENGIYQPERETISFDEADERHFSLHPPEPAIPDTPAPGPSIRSLQETARDASIAQASITALVKNITEIEAGRTKTPYKLSRADGLSTEAARNHPATSNFIAINEFIADCSATPVATAIA